MEMELEKGRRGRGGSVCVGQPVCADKWGRRREEEAHAVCSRYKEPGSFFLRQRYRFQHSQNNYTS